MGALLWYVSLTCRRLSLGVLQSSSDHYRNHQFHHHALSNATLLTVLRDHLAALSKKYHQLTALSIKRQFHANSYKCQVVSGWYRNAFHNQTATKLFKRCKIGKYSMRWNVKSATSGLLQSRL